MLHLNLVYGIAEIIPFQSDLISAEIIKFRRR